MDDEFDDESYDEPSPEPTMGDDMQVSTFPFQFEEDLFEDYGNTSNYHCQKRPPTPVTPPDPLEECYLRETMRKLTMIMSTEWLQEVETSP